MNSETLDRDVAWDPSGHLSEVALSAAADGEDSLLDESMHGHLASCETCALQLGRVALRSDVVARAFEGAKVTSASRSPAPIVALAAAPTMKPAPLSAPVRRRKVPVVALGVAMIVAVIGAVPSIATAPAWMADAWTVGREVAPSFLRLFPRALARAWSGPSGSLVVVTWGVAIALCAIGFVIAKRASKKALLNADDGGRR